MKSSTHPAKQNIPHMLRNKARTTCTNILVKQLGKLFTNLSSLPSYILLELMGMGSLAFSNLVNARNDAEGDTRYFTFTNQENSTNYFFKINIINYIKPGDLMSIIREMSNACNSSIPNQVATPLNDYALINADCGYDDSSDIRHWNIELFKSIYNNSEELFEHCLDTLLKAKCANSDGTIMMFLMLTVLILWSAGVGWVAYKDCQRNRQRHENYVHIPSPYHMPFVIRHGMGVIREEDELAGDDDIEPLELDEFKFGDEPGARMNNRDELFEGRRQREGYPNMWPLRFLSISTAHSPHEGKASSSRIVESPHSQLYLPSPAMPPSAPATPNPGSPKTEALRNGKSFMRK